MATRTTRQHTHLVIIDPHSLLPQELQEAIRTNSGWSVAGKHSRRKPTVALIVVGEHEQPFALVHRFFTAVAAIPTIVYDVSPHSNRQASAFSAGANGYVVSGVTIEELACIMQITQLGGFGSCSSAIRMMREQMRAPLEFSRREQEVVTLYALGANVQTVAEELNTSVKIVEDALERACRKAGVESPVALVTWWTRWTMLEECGNDYDENGTTTRYAMTA